MLVIGKATMATLLALIEGPAKWRRTQSREQSLGATPSAAHPLAALTKDYFPRCVLLPVAQQ
jgi:hypothetical protein